MKFAERSYEIIKLTFANFSSIKSLPLKCITEVTIRWNLQFTLIWYHWFPSC